jgi:hypothetical protein
MPQLRHALAARVALAADDAARASDAARALAARGISAEMCDLRTAVESGAQAVAFAPNDVPSLERAAGIAPLCAELAADSRPVVMLDASLPGTGKKAIERAAAVAYLRAHGAIHCDDPDMWLETIVLLAAIGCPAGPRTAIVAPPDSWLSASASALAREAAARGARFSTVYYDATKVGSTDAVLVDRSEAPRVPLPRARGALIVPVIGRAELLSEERGPALVGLRSALGAVRAAGRYAERLAAGLGPARSIGIEPEREALERRLSRLGPRAGDHETKLLLAAYGVPVTRQAVATTPSAAARKAKDVGWPVEIKPWGPDVPSERDGCPVERNIESAADVRRAYAAVAKTPGATGAAVIVRETPPVGRELAVTVIRLGPLGLTVVVDIPGTPEPIAAPAPLREVDAAELARSVEATRAGDLEPDRESLAQLLLRAAALVAENARIEKLEMSRVIAAARGDAAIVVDARIEMTE